MAYIICVEDKNHSQVLDEDLGHLEIRVSWVCKHHIEEIFCVRKMLLWVNNGQASTSSESNCSQNRKFRNELYGWKLSLEAVSYVEGVVNKRAKRSYYTAHNGHRVSIHRKSLVEIEQLLVNHQLVLAKVIGKLESAYIFFSNWANWLALGSCP